MSDMNSGTGSCLCGGVRVSVAKLNANVGACHCGMCRKWSGGPFFAADCGTDVAFEGEDNLTVYNSSAWAERGFCKKCGSHVFYRLKASQHYMLSAGLFDDQSEFVLDHQIFIDKKPDFYNFANETVNMTEAEVFAKFGAS